MQKQKEEEHHKKRGEIMYYFIVNPKSRSGKGMDIWREVKDYLDSNKVVYKAVNTRYEGHATKLAKSLSQKEAEIINLIVIGGDGTINEVINGIQDFNKIYLGVIPTGSGNDFARGLGIKSRPVEMIEKIITNPQINNIDMGQVVYGDNNRRNFAISGGVGLDAIVCKKALTSKIKKLLNKIHMGKLTYLILTVQTLFSMTTADFKVWIDGEEREYNKVIFAAAMNFKTEGGGVPMTPKAVADDGELSMCIVHTIPKWRTFFCLPLLCMAKHEKLKGFEIFNCKECKISISRPMVLHGDGEYLGDVKTVTFTCIPDKLNIIL